MAESANETPQPKRRLGLRLRKGVSTTPGQRRQPLQQTPIAVKSVETPRALETPLNVRKANSTSCRRLGLSHKRKDLSKKKLEFADTAIEHELTKAAQKTPAETPINNWRQSKIIELEADIEVWRNGFMAATKDLQDLFEPRATKETLLRQLGIPLEMLQYLDED
ncbi:uncharacterized protein LOC6568546 [Drosophila grimshawi]|uniref:GH17435 n=1 Tax=Drosophila grimshawi TaxID=7222 RepID=B4JVB1_DROGR|nr:uncharacterized protein LOC6568546 [Drosophila grimshawi]EDV91431.1 GH17435 [Drosophila grimshawi]